MSRVLMGRSADWSKPHLLQLELCVRLIGNYQVPDVRWIESAAKDADFHRLLSLTDMLKSANKWRTPAIRFFCQQP